MKGQHDLEATLVPAQLQEIPDFLGQVLSDLILLIPRLIGALIILLIGWFVGRIVARVVSTLADRTEIDRRTMQTPIGDMLGGTERTISNAFGTVSAYYVYFLAILAAANALQIPLLSAWIADAASYLPAFIAGLLIIVVGFIVADFVGDVIERTRATTHSGITSVMANGVRVFLYFIVIVVGLDTMQVDVGILYIFAAAIAGGLGLALAIGFGIAFGFGARDYVAENIDDWAGQASAQVETPDTRPETRGSGTSGTNPDLDD
ncbi:mechanosensitive ion channel family protein [Halalkalicoccus ordinarius]|uniref:mechanosensitive ion channel family protein n=1 Tax=Halalkalicoccus ordinarius TaxID=3116651 RepID=UPI00300E8934